MSDTYKRMMNFKFEP